MAEFTSQNVLNEQTTIHSLHTADVYIEDTVVYVLLDNIYLYTVPAKDANRRDFQTYYMKILQNNLLNLAGTARKKVRERERGGEKQGMCVC